MRGDFIIELRGLAIVIVDADGKTHVDIPQRIVATSALGGAVWGLLLGVLFLVPGLGILGGALGALFGTLSKTGINNSFARGLRRCSDQATPPSSSRLQDHRRPLRRRGPALRRRAILKTSLSETDERELADAIAGSTN